MPLDDLLHNREPQAGAIFLDLLSIAGSKELIEYMLKFIFRNAIAGIRDTNLAAVFRFRNTKRDRDIPMLRGILNRIFDNISKGRLQGSVIPEIL